ncbi:unnamed protein product [Caenorhabditis auriculariae]|uniref:Activin types I and II receptor domain-containing protein n=1 Tax=Caenorhabditis auriculariae TaxID=2777116 RepID=A0A8S1HFK4_9PELO|nr:unnamed protein product [Caenorhabditis auriculariae]
MSPSKGGSSLSAGDVIRRRIARGHFRLLICLLVLFMTPGTSEALQCLEGSDCELDASCTECSGVACTRVTSSNLDDNKEIALTCVPYDTRSFPPQTLIEQGCTKVGERQVCVCYQDYCNSSSQTSVISFLLLVAFFFHIRHIL